MLEDDAVEVLRKLSWVLDWYLNKYENADQGADQVPASPWGGEAKGNVKRAAAEVNLDRSAERDRLVSLLPEMVRIPAGRFLMGCQPGEKDCHDAERPAHWVKVAAFELGKYAVTFAQWDACVADGGCRHQPDDAGWGRGKRPVINVSWDDAQEYLAWLSRKTGEIYRLPTEAEWEYAARAETQTTFSTGNCIKTDQANYDGNYDYADCGAKTGVYLQRTQAVGTYPANPWGLYDMHGNVWEWVQDCWHDSYNGAVQYGSEWRDAYGASWGRVVRGGSWVNYPRYLRSAFRIWIDSADRYNDVGFRVARTLAP